MDVIGEVSKPKVYKANKMCERSLELIGVESDSPLSWSPDGEKLAYVSGNHSIYISELVKDRWTNIDVLVGHNLAVDTLLFHDDGQYLVSSSHEGVFIWEWQKSKLLKKLTPDVTPAAHEGPVEALAWAWGGTCLLTGSKDCDVKAWDVLSGFECIETVHGHKAPVLAIAFHEKTRIIASAGRDSSIKLWDGSVLDPEKRAQKKEEGSMKVTLKSTLDGHRGDITALEWDKNGRLLYSGARDNMIIVWDTFTGDELRQIPGSKGDIRRLYFMCLGPKADIHMLFAGSADKHVRLYRLANQALSPLGKEVSETTVDDFLVETSDVLGEQAVPNDEVILAKQMHDSDIQHMAVNKKKPFLATSSSESEVRIWNIQNLQNPTLAHEFVGHAGPIMGVDLIHKDQRFLSLSKDFNIFFYEARTSTRLARFNFLGSALCGAINPTTEDIFFVGGHHYDIKAYCINPQAPQCFKNIALFKGHCGKVEALAISPDAKVMVSGGHDFNILIWKLTPPGNAEGDMIFKLKDGPKGEEPAIVRPYDTKEAHRGHVVNLAFSEDGKLLASAATDHSVTVWKVSGTSLSKSWSSEDAHESVVTGAIWGRGPSAHLLVTCSWDHSVKVWDHQAIVKSGGLLGLATKNVVPLKTLVGHTARVTDAKVTKDGKWLITSSADCSCRVWQLTEPFPCEARYIAPSTEGAFNCLSAGETTFISGSENGMIRLWPLLAHPEHDKYFKEDTGEVKIIDELAQVTKAAGPVVIAGTAMGGGGGGAPEAAPSYTFG